MKTKNVLIYETTTGHFIQTTEEKYPDVEITEEGRLFIGNKEVDDYSDERDKYNEVLDGQLPTRYVIRKSNGKFYGFEGGFDLIKDDDGNLFWYSGTLFKNLEDAFNHINDKLGCEDWIICLEEPMQS